MRFLSSGCFYGKRSINKIDSVFHPRLVFSYFLINSHFPRLYRPLNRDHLVHDWGLYSAADRPSKRGWFDCCCAINDRSVKDKRHVKYWSFSDLYRLRSMFAQLVWGWINIWIGHRERERDVPAEWSIPQCCINKMWRSGILSWQIETPFARDRYGTLFRLIVELD